MGKDQELLDAARNGNVSVVEKILSQRAKRSGPLASLRRGPGANVQDNSGYTPLHHSALNGHKDIVTLLLAHDASPNVTDHKGSSPLHLAAWTGNTEIVKLLLVQSNVQPNVNLKNGDGDTPLHCAAQYGHVDVVNLLLQHNCDPAIPNTKDETSLDLAAQYGRLETVESLVKSHPELLTGCHTKRHSALHLASRNGHKQVVQVLLNSGFPVNAQTDGGSALHEAATFGKVDVVRVLLDNGIDIESEDYQHHTVMDILIDLKTHKSQEIATIIKNHSTLITTADYDIRNANNPPHKFVPRTYENISLPKWASMDGSSSVPGSGSATSPLPNSISVYQIPPRTPRSISVDLDRRISGTDVYQVPPTPEPLESSFEGSDLSATSSVYQTPPPPREIDAMSIGSSYYETPPTPREVTGKNPQRTSMPEGDPTLLYQVPPPPREIHKRMSDPSSSLSGCPLRTSCGPDVGEFLQRQLSNTSGYISMAPVQTPLKYLRPPPLKPPRKSASPHSPTKFQVQTGPTGVAYEYLCLASSGGERSDDDGGYGVDNEREQIGNGAAQVVRLHNHGGGDYVDMKVRRSYVPPYENDIPYFKNQKSKSGLSGDESEGGRGHELSPTSELMTQSLNRRSPASAKPAISPRSKTLLNENEKRQKPNTLDFKSKRRSWDGEATSPKAPSTDEGMPLSPTGYKQPPTPDFPPPSPRTAETGIHEKMRPMSQEYKRRSRDNETLTEDEVFQLIQHEHGEITLRVVTKENKSVSTENIEEITGDVPFAGLHRGSKVNFSSSSEDTCDESNYHTPCSLSSPGDWSDQHNTNKNRRQTNVYENVSIKMDPLSGQRHLSVQSSNGSHYENSILSPFDENAEWAKINDIMAAFGGTTFHGRNLDEKDLINNCYIGRRSVSKDAKYGLSPVGQWLSKWGMGQYENIFLINGFDDLQFMGGDMIEDQDLLDMNITDPTDRKTIVEAAKGLRPVPVIRTSGKGTPCVPDTVDDWLHSIHLDNYIDTFHKNKYGDMERVIKMWEVELTTILEITRPGHKKRILASLGERPLCRNYGDVNELSSDLKNLKLEINQLDQMGKPKVEPNVNGTLKRRNGGHNKPPAPAPPPRRSSSKSPCDPNGNKDGFSVAESPSYANGVDDIIIRDPSQLFTGIPTSLTTQWRHKLEDFIVGSCNYTAKYLGSTLVKELKGVESSKKSIQKLKKSTNEIAKIPNVILSISYKGVKFIDANTKNEVCEHEIRNINCACQDADDLNHFAYITKDHLTGNHYCHVFSVAAMDMATEIILTLGQAFEVAYQVALRDKNLESSKDKEALKKLPGPHPPLVSPRARE